MVSFNVGKEESKTISLIVRRAIAEATLAKLPRIDPLQLEMDITATHCNGNPLRLEDMLTAPVMDLMHDIVGIRRHLDRKTGKLGDCFSPRYSR